MDNCPHRDRTTSSSRLARTDRMTTRRTAGNRSYAGNTEDRGSGLRAAWGRAPRPSPPCDPAEELVVAVRSTVAGETILSAGVLDRVDDSNVYVLTAAHALQAGPARASQITVILPFARSLAVPARILKIDATLDLAALRVAATATQLASLQKLPFDALGSSKALVQGSQVFHSGHPNGMLWQMSVAPNFVTKHEGPLDLFRVAICGQGQFRRGFDR